MSSHILVIEDDAHAGTAMVQLLEREGYQVDLARDGVEGLDKTLNTPYDLVITDIVMPRMDGQTLFKELKVKQPETPIIIMTAHGNIEMAVEAMRNGAADFMEKPLNLARVRMMVAKVLSGSQLERENRQLKKRLGESYGLDNLLGDAPVMHELKEQILQVAGTDASVLLLGESGTGKELVANALHANSKRKNKPFIKINCSALPDELLQSELFGHVKGAFTGAAATRKGRFEEADGGTVFLDEIGDLPQAMQVKLLRVLQEGTFERVGDNETIKVNLRIITATHVDLDKAIKSGKMREDFYYRIKGITLDIPPLRQRQGDIELLARHFLNQAGRENLRFSNKALEVLRDYPWPGNVRQLRNVCETIAVFCKSEEVHLKDLPAELLSTPPASATSGQLDLMPIAEAEKILIQKALDKTGGNKTEAARLLGIGLRTLYRKLDAAEDKM